MKGSSGQVNALLRVCFCVTLLHDNGPERRNYINEGIHANYTFGTNFYRMILCGAKGKKGEVLAWK